MTDREGRACALAGARARRMPARHARVDMCPRTPCAVGAPARSRDQLERRILGHWLTCPVRRRCYSEGVQGGCLYTTRSVGILHTLYLVRSLE